MGDSSVITSIVRRRRPRRPVLLLLGAAVAAAAAIASVAVAAVVNDSGSVSVEVADKDHSSGLVSLAYAKVEYIGSSANNQSSGTGIFDPFVRLQGSPIEKGYNTNGAVAFDTKAGQWTHAIKASAIPTVDCDGSGPGTARCWELFNDINENNTAKYISLNEVEIWFTTNPSLVGFVDPSGFPSGATKVYDFSGDIRIHDVNQGSGRGDLRYLIPLTSIDAFTNDTYFVLYSKWGTSAATSPDGNGYGTDGGFEEWKVRKTPNIHITKTANPVGPVSAGTSIGFDVSISNTGTADATGVTISDALPAGGGLNWSLSPAFSGCSITGAVGAQTLSCSFATLAAGASLGPIHITSGTSKLDCAVISNTATIAATNADGGTSTATVTVQCPDVSIVKAANPVGPVSAGDPIGFDITVSNAGPGDAANVTVSDPLPAGLGSDLDWSLDPSFAGCSITGAVGSQSLSCTFASLASGGSIGPIHITSGTSQQDCADVSNTATVASGNDGGGSSTDTVSVQCAAIRILKESTKAGNPLVLNAGAVFSYGTGLSVTDTTDGTLGDEDTAIGSVCVSGLAPGTYTVNEEGAPVGYGAATQTNQSVEAVNGTNCTTNLPSGSGVVTFTNAPLSDIQVNFRDGGSNETNATISCDNTTGTSDTTAVTGWDSSDTITGIDAPTTIICTITIDP